MRKENQKENRRSSRVDLYHIGEYGMVTEFPEKPYDYQPHTPTVHPRQPSCPDSWTPRVLGPALRKTWGAAMKPVDLYKPSQTTLDLRVQVVIKAGEYAEQIRKMAEEFQLEPAAVLRMLAIEALKLRRTA